MADQLLAQIFYRRQADRPGNLHLALLTNLIKPVAQRLWALGGGPDGVNGVAHDVGLQHTLGTACKINIVMLKQK